MGFDVVVLFVPGQKHLDEFESSSRDLGRGSFLSCEDQFVVNCVIRVWFFAVNDRQLMEGCSSLRQPSQLDKRFRRIGLLVRLLEFEGNTIVRCACACLFCDGDGARFRPTKFAGLRNVMMSRT